MGAWSSSLYGNDTTCDVHDSYIAFLDEGITNEEAYTKLTEAFHDLIGDQDEPLYWYALAETQWKTGRLLSEVKEKALDWIDKGGGIELWNESARGGAGWLKTLEKLKTRLETPMPREKKFTKPPVLDQNPWNLHDIYAYQFHSQESNGYGCFDKYILLQKIGEDSERFESTTMRIQVYDQLFDSLPTLIDIDGVRLLPLDLPSRTNMNCCITAYKKWAYPKKYLTFIGNRNGPANKKNSRLEMSWERIDDWLSYYYSLWRGVKYDMIGDGEYRYNPNCPKATF
jgi:hypothetical protein